MNTNFANRIFKIRFRQDSRPTPKSTVDTDTQKGHETNRTLRDHWSPPQPHKTVGERLGNMFGKNNLHVAPTGMNMQSSRSNFIFTIKLMKYTNVSPTKTPDKVVVSSFSICDLPGAEREKKMHNVGLRLKESQNINGSLHVLSRCFNIIRENQFNKEKQRVPYRDSKLTQLFQHALEGQSTVTMIVNVNTDKDLCEETQHVLKATAVAKHIVVQPKARNHRQQSARMSMFSQIIHKNRTNRSTMIRWDSCVRPTAPNSQTLSIADSVHLEDEQSELEKKQENYENILGLVETYKEKWHLEKEKHLQTKKMARKREDEIREEMKAELRQMLEQAKMENDLELKRAQKLVECSGKKLDDSSLVKSAAKRPRQEVKDSEEDLCMPFEFEDLKYEVHQQQRQIEELTNLVCMQREEKKQVSMNLSHVKMELMWRDKEIENLKRKIDILGEEGGLKESYLKLEKAMEEQIKIRNNLLDEAKTDYLDELSKNEDLENEISKLEQELAAKEEEIEDLRDVHEANEKTYEILRNRCDEMEEKFKEEMREMEIDAWKQEIELNQKYKEIEELKLQLENQVKTIHGNDEYSQELLNLKTEYETLKSEKSSDYEELQKKYTDMSIAFEEAESRLESLKEENLKVKKELSELVQQTNNDKSNINMEVLLREEQVKQLELQIEILKESLAEQEKKIRQELEEEYDEKVVELTIKVEEETEAKLEGLKSELNLTLKEKEDIIIKLKEQLEEMITEKKMFKADLEQAKEITNKLQQDLTEKAVQIETLGKLIESSKAIKKEDLDDHSKEVTVLEKSLKQQIQDTERVAKLYAEANKKGEDLNKKLQWVRNEVEDLKNKLKKKEHELECSKSEVVGYQNSLPTLQSELEQQRKCNNEYKKRIEDKNEIIFNMEKEGESFKANQKEIVSRYEEQLKKTKEENDVLKKEVAKVAHTFYKSTPTPKKDLEKKVESLQKEKEELTKKIEELTKKLEDLRHQDNRAQEISAGNDWLQVADGYQEKENDCAFEEIGSKKTGTGTKAGKNKARRVRNVESQSSDEDVSHNERARAKSTTTCGERLPVPVDHRAAKSASKTRSLRTRTTNVVAGDSDVPATVRTQKQCRKELYSHRTPDETFQADDFEEEEIAQESPRTVIKRTLRTRNKNSTTSSKQSAESHSCIGCEEKRVSRKKLFTQDPKALWELVIEDSDFCPLEEKQENPLAYRRRIAKEKNKLKKIIV